MTEPRVSDERLDELISEWSFLHPPTIFLGAALDLRDARADAAELRDKALRYDLDQAGISQREREACELVELRAECERLHALRVDDAVEVGRIVMRIEAERDEQRARAEKLEATVKRLEADREVISRELTRTGEECVRQRARAEAAEKRAAEADAHVAELRRRYEGGDLRVAIEDLPAYKPHIVIDERDFEPGADEIAALRARCEALAGALERIDAHGCSCVHIVPDGEGSRTLTCADKHPDDDESWCWSCLARAALARHREETTT